MMKFQYSVAILFSILVGQLFAQTTFNSSGTYTTGAGITCLRVQVWAAGGGGAGNASSSDGGGGGGGGGYSESFVFVTPSTNYTVTVGVGGAGGTANNNGGNGGNSWFSTPTTVFAYGGIGGVSSQSNGFNGGVGGSGGVAGIGDFAFAGGNGGNGSDNNWGRGGGGGSSAGTAGNGSNGTNGTGFSFGSPGVGGAAPVGGGNGGNGGNRNQDGFIGIGPGGGGGGAGESSIGANGANGRVIITASGGVCPTGTTIAPAATQTFCAGLPTNVLTASSTFPSAGCSAGIQYQWYSNILNSNFLLTATAIPGAINQTFTPPNGVVGTFYYFCIAYSPACGQTSTTGSLASNVVRVNILTPPTTPNAGPDQSICVGNNTTMAANNPTLGTASWTILSGPSVLTSQLSSTTNPNAAFNPVGGIGSYVLRWSITASCGTLTDDVVINVTCGGSCAPCVYQHPSGIGIAGEKVGSCEVADCGPSIYNDDGGPTGNYSNNIGNGLPQNAVYRVFCPSLAGNCTTVTFNSFNTFNNQDVLYVRNGPTEFSPNFTGAPNANSAYNGNPAWNNGLWGDLSSVVPFSFTSTHPSGCLAFAFVTSGSNTAPGWTATINCTPCAGGPSGMENSDCINATHLCSNSAVPSNSTGPGIVAEGCNGSACPAGGENHTNWYSFTAATSGSLSVTVSPTTPSDDYDFAIFGPNVTCGSLGAPIRCSDSGSTGTTGALGNPTPDPSSTTESVFGDKFVDELIVNAGETYYLMIDEWTPTGQGYNLTFGGTASLNCALLPIELAEFEATYSDEFEGADLYWKTLSEFNNDYFTIEKSMDALNYEEVTIVKGAGTTNSATEYYAFDPEVEPGVTYYRLKQTDFDGAYQYSDIRTINRLKDGFDVLTFFPNPTNGRTEVIFNCYEPGLSQMTVMDARGVVVLTQELESTKGGNRVEFDLQDHSAGVYFVSIVTRNKTYTGRVIRN